MRSYLKVITTAVLIAIPAPIVLVFLLGGWLSPQLVQLNPADEMGLAQPILAYLATLVLFVLVSVLTEKLVSRAPAAAKPVAPVTPVAAQRPAPQAPRSQSLARGPQVFGAPERQAPAAPVVPARGSEEGTVKWFNVKKGFGFISRPNGEDLFVHFRAIQGDGRRILRQGERVTYLVVDASKGLQADKVVSLEEA